MTLKGVKLDLNAPERAGLLEWDEWSGSRRRFQDLSGMEDRRVLADRCFVGRVPLGPLEGDIEITGEWS
ncbi:hypothetical protein Pure05_04550 [Paenarthrobacter ureafaciens]|nr:hypothetical protein Pure01_01060 [Paenarthrobacter ureafaciens]GLU62207.1 hypothetical protein Pure02_04570 [Paenarthrobacter ureafaciens]GLU66481.1 hypothetical protein Pure03_04570 [Paenarthrobacter ureafaciens]GLU70394.1 hypothetical protein Pure04_01090 [Paenarthrobacter ureafaciens]GLU75015.1 hypothetical protein Pure05_04550 [Paenarthrobacter ureafaciens]